MSDPNDVRREIITVRKAMRTAPGDLEFECASNALVVIDMRRDLVVQTGLGETPGKHVSILRVGIAPCRLVLETARAVDWLIIHIRQRRRPDRSGCPPAHRGQLGNPLLDQSRTMRVPVMPASARPMLGGLVISPSPPPPSRNSITAMILGPMLPRSN